MSVQVQTIRVVPAAPEMLESFLECLDSVARERKWLGMVKAHPPEEAKPYWDKQFALGSPAFFALDGNRVVGFVNVELNEREGIKHRGLLGMGVHIDYRGQGIGGRLMEAALEKARQKGLMRVDLTVYASNTAGLSLYHKYGFVEEGLVVKGRYLDGRFDDTIPMGLIFEENLPNAEKDRSGR